LAERRLRGHGPWRNNDVEALHYWEIPECLFQATANAIAHDGITNSLRGRHGEAGYTKVIRDGTDGEQWTAVMTPGAKDAVEVSLAPEPAIPGLQAPWTVRRARPFARRRWSTWRPLALDMRFMKPWRRRRRRFFG